MKYRTIVVDPPWPLKWKSNPGIGLKALDYATFMLRRCGQHQADGAAPHHHDLAPVQSHDREPAPTGSGEDLPPSDLGFADVLRYVMQGEADAQVARLNARG